MKKTEIVALGIAEEIADKVIELSKAELEDYVPKSRFNEVNEAKKNAETMLKDVNTQLEGLKANAKDSEVLQHQIEELQNSNKEAQKKYDESILQMRIDYAVEKAIADANGKNTKAIKALLNLENAKISDDGTIEGLKEQIKGLTEKEDSSFLFGTTVPSVKGFNPSGGTNPNGGQPDFKKMSYSEIAEYLNANPEATIS